MRNSLEIQDLDLPSLNRDQNAKLSEEACTKYYRNLLQSTQQQIQNLGIIPTIPAEIKATVCELLKEGAGFEAVDEAVKPIFDMVDEHLIKLDNNVPQWQTLILQCMILKKVTPESLGKKASKGNMQLRRVQDAIKKPILMKLFLEGGEPKNEKYGKAYQLYLSILKASTHVAEGVATNNIFHRLAIAVALEHAEPIFIFDTKNAIDPLARYLHYEQAYLNGELDPYFTTLSIWDLRMVVDNDASDEEIQFCREMMRNYRPDHVLDLNYHWKYCRIVKTEVRYKTPDWKTLPKTYKQLISGGGKCGPRAWFGRYACKSFGVPTWGIRQPGHAAMSHWMPSSSWVICLGGPNWMKSYWDKRNGRFFDWEARARACSVSFQDVIWFNCFSRLLEEKNVLESQVNFVFHKNTWAQLKWMKNREIALREYDEIISEAMTKEKHDEFVLLTSIERVSAMEVNLHKGKISLPSDEGNITIPASACFDPQRETNKVLFMKSFLPKGGDQIHLRENGSVKYRIEGPNLRDKSEKYLKYNLSLRIVSVHADVEKIPLIIEVENESSSDTHKIKIPYTEGKWVNTDFVALELMNGKINTLKIFREDASSLGISIKDFTLEKIN